MRSLSLSLSSIIIIIIIIASTATIISTSITTTVSVLWPYLIDALYSIISGCDDGGLGLDCRQWIHNTLYSSFINIPTPSKTIIFNGIFRYAIRNKKQFKSLMQDFIKVCNLKHLLILLVYMMMSRNFIHR
jgi:hypothetical protein